MRARRVFSSSPALLLWAALGASVSAQDLVGLAPADPLVADTAASTAHDKLPADINETIKVVWKGIVDEAERARGPSIVGPDADATRAKETYKAMALQLTRDTRVVPLFTTSDAVRRQYLSQRIELNRAIAGTTATLARSVNAAATNPSRVGLIERSGLIDLVALALQGTNLVSADDTAVTLNLNAVGLFGVRHLDDAPASRRYREQGWRNRLAGSLTFGAKIPEKAITGFSGLPDAEKLFDVFIWDAKVRLIGDRDPRAADWDDLLLGRLGGLNRIGVIVGADERIPEAHIREGGPLERALTELTDATVADVERRIRSSLQISVKFSGQHLTEEKGMNKYTGTLLLDKGFGPADLSVNASYSAVQQVPTGTTSSITFKEWRVAGGLVASIWRDVLVSGLASELALSGEAAFPVDGDEVPLRRRRVWKADAALKFPVTKTIQLPFSVTWTNDPNGLVKHRFVTGRVGINYDFGSLKKLLNGG